MSDDERILLSELFSVCEQLSKTEAKLKELLDENRKSRRTMRFLYSTMENGGCITCQRKTQ